MRLRRQLETGMQHEPNGISGKMSKGMDQGLASAVGIGVAGSHASTTDGDLSARDTAGPFCPIGPQYLISHLLLPRRVVL